MTQIEKTMAEITKALNRLESAPWIMQLDDIASGLSTDWERSEDAAKMLNCRRFAQMEAEVQMLYIQLAVQKLGHDWAEITSLANGLDQAQHNTTGEQQ